MMDKIEELRNIAKEMLEAIAAMGETNERR